MKVYKIRDNIEIPLQSLPVSLPEEADVWERLLEVSELLIHELTLLVHMDVVIVMGTENGPQESLHLPHSFACRHITHYYYMTRLFRLQQNASLRDILSLKDTERERPLDATK